MTHLRERHTNNQEVFLFPVFDLIPQGDKKVDKPKWKPRDTGATASIIQCQGKSF